MCHRFAYRQSNRSIFLTDGCLPRSVQVCVKLTKNKKKKQTTDTRVTCIWSAAQSSESFLMKYFVYISSFRKHCEMEMKGKCGPVEEQRKERSRQWMQRAVSLEIKRCNFLKSKHLCCMCICICICESICAHAFACVHLWGYPWLFVCVYAHVYMCISSMSLSLQLWVYVCICVSVCMMCAFLCVIYTWRCECRN